MDHPNAMTSDPKAQGQPDARTLRRLIRKAKKDPRFFAELYDLYFSSVYRYVYSRVADQKAAEDITSKTFLTALQHLPAYQERGLFAAWLFTIARSKLNDHFREQSRYATQAVPEFPDERRSPLASLQQKEALARMRELIRDLPEPKQDLLKLRFAGELSFKEIASIQGKTVAAVKKAFYRTLDSLRSQMEAEDE
ncbi:MAG: hypothetical protein PWQ55_2728 [Chloroflexota bacterium]|nr:hypothetical protein [Chloroflexota bacterium]